MDLLTRLFVCFALVGLGAYGGGLVTIPLIQHQIVQNQQWLDFDEMSRVVAIAQMTPGPIAVNAATFVGFRLAGITGAAVATLAVVLPSIVILALLAPFADRVRGNRHARKLRQGIQLGALSLILFATWSYGRAAISGWQDFVLGAGAFACLIVFEGKLHPILVILACGVVGLLLF